MIIAPRWRGAAILAAFLLATFPADAAHRHRHARIAPEGLGAGETVEGVEPHSPAARVGLRPGDVIVSINGQPIGSFGDIGPAVTSGGRRLVVQVRRNGSLVRVIAHARGGVLGVSKMVSRPGIVFGHSDDTFIPPPPIPPTPPEPPFPIQAY